MNAEKGIKSFMALGLLLSLLIVPPLAAQEEGLIRGLQDRIEAVAENVGRSCVSITTRARSPRPGATPFDDDFLDRLPPEFRDLLPRRRQPAQPDAPEQSPLVPRGLGAGVIISADGLILTNQHVIEGAEEIEVTLADGRSFDGKLIGSDPRSDLAVIKIEQENLPVAKIGRAHV